MAPTKQRRFSIQGENGTWLPPIPWVVIQAHEKQALQNHHQPLEQLQKRGGLTPKEALHVLLDVEWGYSVASQEIQHMTVVEADQYMREIIAVRLPLYTFVPPPRCQHGPRPEVLDGRGVEKCPVCNQIIHGVGGT